MSIQLFTKHRIKEMFVNVMTYIGTFNTDNCTCFAHIWQVKLGNLTKHL